MASIYLDNAATTPLYPGLANDMCEMMSRHYGNPSSIHAYGRQSKTIIEASRKQVAQYLGAALSEVFFTSSATESNNTVLYNAVLHFQVKHIIYSAIEHPCVINTAKYLASRGWVTLHQVQVNEQGIVSMHNLIETLVRIPSNEKSLVSIMHANNEIGTLQDLKQIGDICKTYDALFHSDCVQTFGKIPLYLQSLHIHFLSASAHKFHGPKGVGILYINKNNQINPLIYGGSQERNMRAGTENLMGIFGLGKALEWNLLHQREHQLHLNMLKEYFIQNVIAHINGCYINGSTHPQESMNHIVNVSFPASPKSELLVFNLDIAGVAVSSASACSAGIEKDSHVLEAIHHSPDRNAVRFSFSPFNTLDELKKTISILNKIF